MAGRASRGVAFRGFRAAERFVFHDKRDLCGERRRCRSHTRDGRVAARLCRSRARLSIIRRSRVPAQYVTAVRQHLRSRTFEFSTRVRPPAATRFKVL